MGAPDARDVFEIIDDRSGHRSTLVVAQLPVDQWHQMVDDSTVADAIMDRLSHRAHRIVLKGESMRQTKNQFDVTG